MELVEGETLRDVLQGGPLSGPRAAALAIQIANVRSGLFSLAALLSSRRAFFAGTPADTLSAIRREDPPELWHFVPNVLPALDRIVRRCLQKNPAARFRSAADLAFAFEAASTGTGASAASGAASVRTTPAAPARCGARAGPGSRSRAECATRNAVKRHGVCGPARRPADSAPSEEP